MTSATKIAISTVLASVRNELPAPSSASSSQNRSTMPVRMITGKSETYFVTAKSHRLADGHEDDQHGDDHAQHHRCARHLQQVKSIERAPHDPTDHEQADEDAHSRQALPIAKDEPNQCGRERAEAGETNQISKDADDESGDRQQQQEFDQSSLGRGQATSARLAQKHRRASRPPNTRRATIAPVQLTSARAVAVQRRLRVIG